MKEQELLKKIAQNVLLKSSFVSDVGLACGKMGMVLFLMHHARYMKSDLYEEYAGILLDEIYSSLGMDIPVTFESGLCGIGWGTEYLLQNNFIEAEADEMLAEIDRAIMERDPMRIGDLSFETGLAGIIEYVLIRLRSDKKLETRSLFDYDYWEALKKAAHKVILESEDSQSQERARLLLDGIKDPSIISGRNIFDVIHFCAPKSENLWQRPDGLQDGNAGVGLKLILG